MAKRAPRTGPSRRASGPSRRPSTVPISLRFGPELRQRVRRFAAERQLEEATAVRLLVTERLNEVDEAKELAEAEAWQREQALATWERFLARRGRVVPRERIARIFAEALAELDAEGTER